MTIVLALVIFSIIVFVHELGHFWAARRAGIHVEEFSIGIGPRIAHFKRGDTIFSLKLFPLGGSCRMLGEDMADEGMEVLEDGGIVAKSEPNPRSFNSKSVPWRMIVILGGAIMNFALAIVLASVFSMFNSYAEPTVRVFSENSAMRDAGAQVGDRIVRMDGRRIDVLFDFSLFMAFHADGSPIDMVVERDGELINLTVIPNYFEDENRWLVGFAWGFAFGPFADFPEELEGQVAIRRVGFFGSFADGFRTISSHVRSTFTVIGRLFTHGLNFDYLMGPIGIVDAVGGQVSEAIELHGGRVAFWQAVNFTILLSVNLGIMNLLPIPALDGGRMIFLILEAIRRKPIPPEKEGMIHFAGFVLLMLMFVFVAYNDILRFF